MSIEKTIRVLDGFAKVPDGGVLSRGTVVQTNMTGNPNFPDPAGQFSRSQSCYREILGLDRRSPR